MPILSLVAVVNRRCLSLAITVGLAVPSLGPLAHGETSQTRREVEVEYCDRRSRGNPLHALDPDLVTELLDDVGFRASTSGYTWLHLFSWCDGTVEQIGRFLAHGGHRVTARTSEGQTPLHLAAEGNPHAEVISALVDAGADIEAKDDGGDTPLLWAAGFNSNPAVIDALVTAGADIEARDAVGDTPLIVAALHNSPQVVQTLLAAGADIHADRRPAPPPQGPIRFVESRPVPAGITALHAAAWQNEDPAVIGILVEAGANVEAETGLPIGTKIPGKRRPVMCFTHDDSPPLGPPIGPSRGGERPIHAAARSNRNPAVIKALLDAGAEMNARSCSGNTALDLIHRYNRDIRDSEVYWILRDASYDNPR